MKFLPIPILHRSPSTPALHGSRSRQVGSSLSDQSLLRLPDRDLRAYPELITSDTSDRVLERKCMGQSNGSSKHHPNFFHNNPLRAIVFSIIHLSSLRSIFSIGSGCQREKEIAIYRGAERFQTQREERASQVFDIYV